MYIPILAMLSASIASVGGVQPDRQPAIASVPGLTAVVFGNGDAIWISTSKDNGRHFSPPTEVARLPMLMLGRHRGPRVAISGSTLIVTAIHGQTPADPSRGDLVAWRSEDGGHSWARPVVINDAQGSAREGLDALTASKDGELAAVWLDLRVPGTRLMGAYSKDGGATWSRNTLLYDVPGGTICQCCAPSIAFGQNGQASVMFRNATDGARDMYLLQWKLGAGPSHPQKLGTGSWTLNACPMDGGGVAQWEDAVVTAWRRDKTVYLTEPGHPEIAIGEGKDVAVARSARGPYAVWTSPAGVELYEPEKKAAHLLSPSGAFATTAALPDGSVLVAWEEGGRIQLETIE